MGSDVVLAGLCRTPIGSFLGGLAECSAPMLGSVALRAAVQRSGIDPGAVQEVLMGNVLSAGSGQNPARQAGIGAGLGESVGATTVSKVCGSGLKSVMLAAQAIRAGDAQVIAAGGMESMSQAPYLVRRARQGYRLGHAQLTDSLISDGLWDAHTDVHMGTCGDRCAQAYHFTREQQDDFAVESYRRAQRAQSRGLFREELVAVTVPGGKQTTTVTEDEEPAPPQ